jgi:MtrB/PioB family decaheme-associated outer membrane protein
MSRNDQHFGTSQKLIALALFAAFNTAAAADDEVAQLTQPTSSVTAGIAGVSGDSKDRALWGQYNGMKNDSAYGLLDFSYIKLNEDTGSWTVLEGRNLGLDTREVRGLQERQGNWKVFGEYSELTREYPRTINTSLQGAGTTTPTVSLLSTRGKGSDLDLSTERKALTVGGLKSITSNLAFEATYKTEDKDGSRLFGKGFTCPSSSTPAPTCPTLASGNQWALLMLPEPITTRTQEFDGKFTYTDARMAFSAGYYGSFFNNMNNSLRPTITGNLNNGLGNPMGSGGAGVPLTPQLQSILQQPMALAPDNQAHQLYLSGTYGITPTTRANFKVAYTHATQFDYYGTTPGGRTTAGGELNTTLAQFGLTARPLPKLSLVANARYEDREDKTPIDVYNQYGASTRFTNTPIPLTKVTGKVEATYALPDNYRISVGGDYQTVDRGHFYSFPENLSVTGLRAKTEETGYRVELRRSMSETLSGSLGYVSTRRNGSSWYRPNTGVEASDEAIFNRTGIFPVTMEDRTRDKVKANIDWSPLDALSLQFVIEDGKDIYNPPSEKGARDSAVRLFGLDASYALSESWRITAYYSYSEQTLHVSDPTQYIAALEDDNNAAGLKVVGKLAARWEVGADLSYLSDRNRYQQSLDPAFAIFSPANVALVAKGGLPDVTYDQTTLKLFAKYALDKNADIRVDLVHQRIKIDEWTWSYNGVPFAYSDNTTVSMNPNQNVTFIGATYTYKWQ